MKERANCRALGNVGYPELVDALVPQNILQQWWVRGPVTWEADIWVYLWLEFYQMDTVQR